MLLTLIVDIYTIPVTKELTDYGLIDAFSYINDKEDKKTYYCIRRILIVSLIPLEKIDEHNMVTLQSILNCLDGHTCVEGTLLFMTANNPEKMDYAMVRSVELITNLNWDIPMSIKNQKYF